MSFSFDTSKLKEKTGGLDRRIGRAIAGVCKYYDGPIEAHLKSSAPWTDRTSNARSGLAAHHVAESEGTHSVVMTYSVSYGKWLELMKDGKYAVIRPTLPTWGPKLIRACEKILDRLDQAAAGGGS